MASCAVVVVKKTGERGCITRRMNAHAYEIWLENGSVAVLAPDDFVEIERKKK